MLSGPLGECAGEFARRYGAPSEASVRAPGRVNLIGEHTDYHEGFVLPLAIERGITFWGRRRSDRRVRVYSRLLGAGCELMIDTDERLPQVWTHYFQGVLRVMSARWPLPAGADVLIDTDLPPGGGLASSSALVVGFGALLSRLYDLDLGPRDLAILGRDAEHWYGTTGGIMDQFVIAHARAGHALLLDCRSLAYEPVPLPGEVAIVIADTGARHDQLASPFAVRRREAETALRVIQDHYPDVRTLRDVEPALLGSVRGALLTADPTGLLWRRCRHVSTENARTRAAAAALAAGDVAAVGRLMAESHASLRDEYEVSSPELDLLVAAATASPGCIGTRMTGGGFGGCTVSLVAREAVEAFQRAVTQRYRETTGSEPTLFTTGPADGVGAR